MHNAMNISEARARLPELAKRVSSRAGAVEYIEHRDLSENLALTTASYIQFLETTLAELKKLKTTPFHLEGSVSSSLSDKDLHTALAVAREEAAVRANSKMLKMLKMVE